MSEKDGEWRFNPILVAIALVAVLIGGAVVYVFFAFYVGIGQVGVVYDISGNIDPNARGGPSIYGKLPWQSVKWINIGTDYVDMWTEYDSNGNPIKSGDWPALDVPTSEGLKCAMDVTVRWHIMAGADFSRLVRSIPDLNYEDKVILPAIREVVRDTTGKHSAIALYGPQRDIISQDIRTRLAARLTSDPRIPDTIELEDFYMRQLFLPVDFERSIRDKQIAEQNMAKASFERQQKLIQANATAQSTIIEAQGMAEAVRLVQQRFQGLSEREVGAYLTYKYIEALDKGFVSGNKVMLFLPQPSGQNMILQLPRIEDLPEATPTTPK
ncbi:prohibitin family protein [Candidatus Bathyarchaeota archaeon]|nr:prohibitin family protein [Candidatus Bathyarchaeota archaeon]